MDERLRFIARFLEGQKMAPPCREFGISRVTVHKIFNRRRQHLSLLCLRRRQNREFLSATYAVDRKIPLISREYEVGTDIFRQSN